MVESPFSGCVRCRGSFSKSISVTVSGVWQFFTYLFEQDTSVDIIRLGEWSPVDVYSSAPLRRAGEPVGSFVACCQFSDDARLYKSVATCAAYVLVIQGMGICITCKCLVVGTWRYLQVHFGYMQVPSAFSGLGYPFK
jgi:hypothetical protein